MNLIATEYRNSPARFPYFRNRLMTRSAISTAIILIFSAAIFFFAEDRDYAGSITISITYIAFIFAVLVFSFFRNLRRQKAVYDSYKLTISDQSITREQSNLRAVTIPLAAIKEIKHNAWGNLEVKGFSPHELIVISPYTENFADIKNWLESRYSVVAQKSMGPLLNYVVMIGVVIIMFVFYKVQNNIIATICGIIMLAVLIWSIYKIQTNSIVEKRTKRISWWLIILVIS